MRSLKSLMLFAATAGVGLMTCFADQAQAGWPFRRAEPTPIYAAPEYGTPVFIPTAPRVHEAYEYRWGASSSQVRHIAHSKYREVTYRDPGSCNTCGSWGHSDCSDDSPCCDNCGECGHRRRCCLKFFKPVGRLLRGIGRILDHDDDCDDCDDDCDDECDDDCTSGCDSGCAGHGSHASQNDGNGFMPFAATCRHCDGDLRPVPSLIATVAGAPDFVARLICLRCQRTYVLRTTPSPVTSTEQLGYYYARAPR